MLNASILVQAKLNGACPMKKAKKSKPSKPFKKIEDSKPADIEELLLLIQTDFTKNGETKEETDAYVKSLFEYKKEGNWVVKTKNGKLHVWSTDGSHATRDLADIFG